MESDLSSELDHIEQGLEVLALNSAHLELDGITPESIVAEATGRYDAARVSRHLAHREV